MGSVVFIYVKGESVKVLDFEQSQKEHKVLVKNKWSHIVTLSSATWLNMLLNLKEPEDIIAEVKELRTIHF